MKMVSFILVGTSLFTLASCGNNKNSSSHPAAKSMLLTEEGYYRATLFPINAHVAGDVSGTAMVKMKGDDFKVEVKINGAAAQIAHAQNIHVADVCPTLVSDTNKDGIIDAIEGQKSYGPALIPLDSDLKTQIESGTKFPQADFSGNYYYRQNVSFAEMLKDLVNKNTVKDDTVVKLKSSLRLAGRQVVVYGVAPTADLPNSVAALKGRTKHSSLPIACGTLIKIAVDEGTNTNGGKDE